MAPTNDLTTAPPSATRRGFALLGIVAVCAAAVLGGNLLGLRDSLLGSATPAPKPVAVSPFAQIASMGKRQSTVLRSQPWWQGVDQLQGGAGTTLHSFSVDRSAAQWRAKWSCQRGSLTVRVAGRAAPLIAAQCPQAGTGVAFATQTGSTKLSVSAAGPWKLQVDQQVDVPLVEPPLPSMTAPGTSTAFSSGLYRIDQIGTGRMTIYRLATGRYVMRLAGFYITPNVDLEIRLSPLRSPHSTHQYLSAPSVLVAPLDITTGSLNFTVPSTVDPTKYHSVVIWCPLINSAYAAAPLTP